MTDPLDLDRLVELAEAARDELGRDFTARQALRLAMTPSTVLALVRELQAAREGRDLAIAHDRQPYPTAWAYEQATAALHRCQSELAALRDKP